ncbi:MAG: nickel pincer cofactor biosynthesis protein LarB [Chloroflexi bacterium]|nr:nickel pincer cofactor biosynthesis protein LarB [Chloroflexota bacterium]
MTEEDVRQLLVAVQGGAVSLDQAVERLKDLPFEDLGFAKLDVHRELRRGFPEVIFGQGKTSEQVLAIAERLHDRHDVVLATRLEPESARLLAERFPTVRLHPEARMAALLKGGDPPPQGDIVVVTAGTADQPVAEEAALTASYMGSAVTRIYDVGVSGLQRLLAQRRRLSEARVIVVVAGMDAALAAVVAGLVEVPIVAVPTSVGYGTAFGGVAPLLTMLNSCSSGVGVVNIDNGFGAGHLASLINKLP